MRLYTLSKRHFVLVFVVFFVCFGLTIFVGIKGKAQGGIILSFTVSLGQCFSARPSCTHLLSPAEGPSWRVQPFLSASTRWRADPGPAPHSSQGLSSVRQPQAALTMYLLLDKHFWRDGCVPGPCWALGNPEHAG